MKADWQSSYGQMKGEGRKLRRARNLIKRVTNHGGYKSDVERKRYERAQALLVATKLSE